jgi:hypothetical protein
MMRPSEEFRSNADHCAELAEKAADEASRRRYRRMEAAWLALAEEQDWLDGKVAPSMIAVYDGEKISPL